MFTSQKKSSLYRCDAVLPFPPPYKQIREIEEEDEKTKMKEMEIVKASLEASIEFSKCPHHESMFDEGTGICMSCGVYTGACFAPLSANTSGVQGAHHHAFSSNVSSSVARKKRNAAILENTIDFGCHFPPLLPSSSSSPSLLGDEDSKRKGANLVSSSPSSVSVSSSSPVTTTIIPKKKKTNSTKAVVSVEGNDDKVSISSTTKRASPVSSFKIANALMVKTFVTSAYTPSKGPPSIRGCGGNLEMKKIMNANYIKTLLEEAFGLQSGHKMLLIGRCKKACEKYIDFSEEEIDALNVQMIEEVQNIVLKHFPKYFSSQRRKIHVFLYVAAILSHCFAVHGSSCESESSSASLQIDCSSCSECLDILRLKSKQKATSSNTQSSSSYILIGARLGIDTKCAGRLVQDAFSLLFDGDTENSPSPSSSSSVI